jgi:hypothetical protein
MFNKATIKTDILLALSMAAGIAGLFGVTLNVPGVDQSLNDLIDAVFIIVPIVLQVFRELQHLKLLGPPPPTTPAT